MISWHLVESGLNSGSYNMEFDSKLVQNCKDDEAYFRLYRWQPYCISLGANQSFDDINKLKADEDGIDIVKRPTGGRAILHAEEITYSVVMPISLKLTPRFIYEKISRALIKGLVTYNQKLSLLELENIQPDFSKILKTETGKLCFASSAKSEVKYNGKKLIGSAQRKIGGKILQHGSILCGDFHKKLAMYINSGKQPSNLFDVFEQKTSELETILNEKIDYTKLAGCLIDGFREEWEIVFVQ
ncbi:MAG: hypothetical protein K9J16_07250 [Melioribacteraceae bacterium]|nr:hypothetical protein [Melioribacteraceae bacterium]MCF8354939.1 hypothetical protein [Melioribacteraceae bacterium]MCF8392372.1 hypothetical protein [Melioribacteraceae bacterium]MCF8417892.1 hypothetical protein [Melioribacteraceae bacterium]